MILRTLTGGVLLSIAALASGSSREAGAIVKTIYKQQDLLGEKQQNHHRRVTEFSNLEPTLLKPSGDENLRHHRHLGQDTCDVAFMECLPDAGCLDCFGQLELEQIDWTGVTPDTTCDGVVKTLTDKGHCALLVSDANSKSIFCNTFKSCVVWEGFGEDDDMVPDEDDEGFVNCTALTECNWTGMHKGWVGDGICHNNIHGCYNTAICGYDGGDCCEDTCTANFPETVEDDDVDCGHDGYACKDPTSAKCDPKLTSKCPSSNDDVVDVTCSEQEQKYRLVMYDSFGDGWDTTSVQIKDNKSTKAVYEGGLKDGSFGVEYICLSREPICYTATTGGGVWGVESSWEIKAVREGTNALAGSGAPNVCDFSVVGEACEKTCTGRPDFDPTDDPDYKGFKELYECVEEKCLIQLASCQADPVCQECFKEDAPEYCFGVDSFVAVIDCSVCKCTDKKDTDYCASKPGPGSTTPPGQEDKNVVRQCTAAETMAGAKAVMDFSECSDVDQMSEMITEFDQQNFGLLDSFETCAHAFANEKNHGGRTALGCMQILFNAMKNPLSDNPNAPKEAIASLAKHLYNEGETFCECAKKSSDDCPLCPNFQKFKTLLYESMDACQALDEIDCDAWSEFWFPCKEALQNKFGSSDFSTQDQCDYAKFESCGGSGPFPAFRRLDCAGELPSDAWDFYRTFSSKCLVGDAGIPPTDAPGGPSPVAPTPTSPIANPTDAPITPPVGKPTPKPYISPDASPTEPYNPPDDPEPSPTPAAVPTPYVPSDQKKTPAAAAAGAGGKKKSHFFRNFFILCLLGAGGYYVYKRRFDSFNFVQYRRGGARSGSGSGYNMMYSGESEMFSNLNSSTTFEPPSLPPTPAAMMGNDGY